MAIPTESVAEIESFSLLGGPLHRLGCRAGLVRDGSNTIPLGLTLGGLLWLAFVAVAALDHHIQSVFSLSVVGIHVRLLFVIPLFFQAETWLEPRMATFVESIGRSGVVPLAERPALNSAIDGTRRWKDSWVAEAVCLLIAIVVTAFGSRLNLPGATSGFDATRPIVGLSMSEISYSIIALSIFRFLMLRWLLRITLWAWFLSRVAKLDLQLVPTHPDLSGGLGNLEMVQLHFGPLILAVSALQAASLAEDLSAGRIPVESALPALGVVLVFDAILVFGPLLFFTPKLWACRVKGLTDYMGLATNYVTRFDLKWVAAAAPPEEPLLGTPDLQSLADLSNSLAILRNMRWAPMSLRTARQLGTMAVAPMLPLLLFKYPVTELAQKFFSRLTGL